MANVKLQKQKECKQHQFIVSHWLFDSKSQKANGWTCQFCLTHVHGAKDIEDLRNKTNADGDA